MLKFLILILCSFAIQPAFAEEKKQTRDQCIARCLPFIAEYPENNERHEAVMKKINAKRKETTEPGALKALDEEESDEMEKYREKHEKLCRSLCKYFPETLN